MPDRKREMLGTDSYTPLSSALWDYGHEVSFDSPELEEAHDELMSRIVDVFEGLEKGIIE